METWRSPTGFPNYEVSDLGRVRRITGASGTHAGKLLKWGFDKDGYAKVTLRGNNSQKVVKVHTLVLTLFKGAAPEGMEGRHLDGNKKNNSINNLAWGTGVENYNDRVRHGTGNNVIKCGTSKLSDKDVIDIRSRYAPRLVTLQTLASEYGVTKQCVRHVVIRKTWAHI